ncbi:Signal transduction histidine kinase [Chitinophaga ginsengisegetis]|uniref:histidine kinase n=1 Tax=Chitinophaga ginsengisegetis TaxID=393003 RepID=A0A1T5P9Z4_9BACT|nr:ATP-binding protein [Chitinophaga ginsengisegetis]SKD09198.1 Signal transduction histidine kinase [Chitinophaga ginsengisegetis]
MKIRTRLILLFMVLFGVLLLAFAVFIYIFSAGNQKDEYYDHLKREAITKANMLLDARVPPAVLQLIYKNANNDLFEEEVAIYDTAFHLQYHDAVDIDKVKETPEMINRIIQQLEIRFKQGTLQVVGFLYAHQGRHYVITAAATDKYGLQRLQGLKYSLIFSYIGIIGLTIIAGYFFVGRALKPVEKMVDKVEEITATNLDLRVPVQNEKDEIGELATTFNKMLDRLEKSFDAQKYFVSNISHELRTPLSTIVGELQIALIKDRSAPEYKEVIRLALTDAQRLVKLSNGLLDLAKASYDQTEIGRKALRTDELLMDARDTVIRSNEGYQVDIQFEQEIEDDDFISVNGNEYLLKVAFVNLMENACKFSANHQCIVTINYHGRVVILRFTDNGIGISATDLPNIFSAFYRGANQDFTAGNGIGLSLTQKILAMHQGTISVTSRMDEGSTFTVEIPHL